MTASGDDAADRAAQSMEQYLERLKSGEPLMQLHIDLPLRFGSTPKGELAVIFAGMVGIGHQAAMVEITIATQAEGSLLNAIAEVRKRRGEPDGASSTLTAQ